MIPCTKDTYTGEHCHCPDCSTAYMAAHSRICSKCAVCCGTVVISGHRLDCFKEDAGCPVPQIHVELHKGIIAPDTVDSSYISGRIAGTIDAPVEPEIKSVPLVNTHSKTVRNVGGKITAASTPEKPDGI